MLVQLCPPPTNQEANLNIVTQDDYLYTLVEKALENNILTNKSQTLIPLGIQGAGKTWTCTVMLRRLLKKCGYGENTDMVKHIEAARDVVRPMVTAAVNGSKDSTRMVRNN